MPSAHLPIKTPTHFSPSKHKLFISESHDMVVGNVSKKNVKKEYIDNLYWQPITQIGIPNLY